jgi:hypothetical protein
MTIREELVAAVAGNLHASQRVEAARLIAVASRLSPKIADNEKTALELCQSLFYSCLNSDRYDLAASIIWTPALLDFRPSCTQTIWKEIQDNNSLMLMGAGSMSKSYGGGAWLLLDWLRDPHFTSVSLVGPNEQHLKDNLFSHLVTLHAQSSLPLPGIIGELFIGMDPRQRHGAIRGVVIPLGKKHSGRLQGRKRIPRPTPHPIFGPLSRIRFMLDEAEKIPVGIWRDLDNVFSNLSADKDGFKLILSFNPEDVAGQVAIRCEPANGWLSVDPDKDYSWMSKRGWRVVRLDAAKCENVISGKEIYPGLQTKEGYDRIIQNSGGVNTPGYWTMCRAMFPRGGAVYSIISDIVLNRCKRQFLFAEEPIKCGAADLALEGKDAAEFAYGRFGKAVGYRYGPTLEYPKGREVLFRDKDRRPKIRWALQVDSIIQLPNCDTVRMAEQIRKEALRLHIAPGWILLDRTGNGAGVHDLLKSLWSEEVKGLNYSEGATERKILEEDTMTCKEEYERVLNEIWFALKKWQEFNFISYGSEAASDDLTQQLTGRRYMPGKVNKVESKVDYKSRGNPSPNKADAVTLLLHLVRLASGCVPSALDNTVPENYVGSSPAEKEPMPIRVDCTNRPDDLEAEDDDEWLA